MDSPVKILVAIDLSKMDDVIIEYATLFRNTLQAGTLVFVHIHDTDHSDSIFGGFKNSPKTEVNYESQAELRTQIQEKLKDVSFPWELDIIEGEIHESLLETVKKHNAQLLILGKKDRLKGSGSLPKKTVKRISCSVLFIPEEPFRHINTILVPVDFSDYSALALKESLFITSKNGGRVICQHIYEVPSGYHRTGKDFYEFAKIMEGHAKNDTQTFLKKNKLPSDSATFIYTLDKDNDPVKLIYNKAKEEKVDMICLGSKGRTAAASIVLGSVAEDLVARNTEFPLLIMKKNDGSLGFFDALSRI